MKNTSFVVFSFFIFLFLYFSFLLLFFFFSFLFLFFFFSFSHKTLDKNNSQRKASLDLVYSKIDIAFAVLRPFECYGLQLTTAQGSRSISYFICELLTRRHFAAAPLRYRPNATYRKLLLLFRSIIIRVTNQKHTEQYAANFVCRSDLVFLAIALAERQRKPTKHQVKITGQ